MEFDKLRKIIAEVLNVDFNEITLDTRFTDDLDAVYVEVDDTVGDYTIVKSGLDGTEKVAKK